MVRNGASHMNASSMTRSSARFLASICAVTLIDAAVVHAAPVDPASATCRAALAKSATKLGATALKAIDGCIKSAVKAGAGDCSTTVIVDTKGKIAAAAQKLLDVAAPGGDCDDSAAAVALSEHLRCGPPIGSALGTFAGVASCLDDLYRADIESLRAAILAPSFAAAAADRAVARCVTTIAKTSTKLFRAVQKEKSVLQNAADRLGGDSAYVDAGDPNGKIARALDVLSTKLASACGGLTGSQWAAVGSCDTTLAGATSCIAAKTLAHGHALIASAYDQPGVCPSSVVLEIAPRARDQAIVSASEIDEGWTGFAHDDELVEGTELRLELDCGAPGNNDCASCSLSFDCEGGNCRCSNDMSLECDEPFGPDADDCGGNVCRALLGPPQPFNQAGLPLCMQYELFEDVSGGADVGTGASTIDIALAEYIHFGIAHNQPCPVCDGTMCNGGARDGLPCDVDGIESYSDLGDVSLDCPPNALSNISGPNGLRARATLQTGTSALALALPCDPPFGGESCLCSVCTGDGTLACNSDAECAAAGAGTCRTDGLHSGADRAPNSCSDLICVDDGSGSGDGTCNTGPDDSYCDGYLKSDGSGLVSCGTDFDCAASGVPDAGTCTLVQRRQCLSGGITSSGVADPEGPILAASYCGAPSSVALLNNIRGLPGPNRLVLDTNATRYCADDTTPWGPGGASCP
jgi:hypothetical protein